MGEQECETCGAEGEVFVYALPGIPMSVGNCRNCLRASAYPLSVAKANTECLGGLENAAEWWKDSITFVEGKGYTPIKVALGVEEKR